MFLEGNGTVKLVEIADKLGLQATILPAPI